MLRLTPTAAARVRQMEGGSLGDGRRPFLRIWRSADDREPGVRMSFVGAAAEGDVLGISQGIPLCVSADVAALLGDMVLDHRPDDSTPLYIRAASEAAVDRPGADSRSGSR